MANFPDPIPGIIEFGLGTGRARHPVLLVPIRAGQHQRGRLVTFAGRRINRIARTIGDDVVRKAVDEVWEAFGKKVDPRAWDIFLHGDRKQTEAFQNELQEEVRQEMMEPQIDDKVHGTMAWEQREEEMMARERNEHSIEHEEQEKMAREMLEGAQEEERERMIADSIEREEMGSAGGKELQHAVRTVQK